MARITKLTANPTDTDDDAVDLEDSVPQHQAKAAPRPRASTTKKTADPMAGLVAPLASRREFVKAVLYGREGTGKSTAAAQASKLGRVLFVDSEGGLKMDALTRLGANPDNILVWPADRQPITATTLEDLHRHLLAAFDDDPEYVTTIVFDSLTEIHHLLREQATEYRVKTSRVELDPDYIDRNDYGRMTNQLRKLVRRFRDLPCNVVFLALERDAEEDDGRKEYRPALTAALCTDVLGYADVVGRFGSADGSFRARFQGNERIRAKDRYGKLPEVLHQPGLDRVVAWINGELTEDSDPVQQEMRGVDAERKAEADRKAAEIAAKKQAIKAK